MNIRSRENEGACECVFNIYIDRDIDRYNRREKEEGCVCVLVFNIYILIHRQRYR